MEYALQLHPCCHLIEAFPLAAKSLCLLCPSSLLPKKQIAQHSSADATNACHLEKPIYPHCACCTWPLAGQTSVWTTPLLGKGLSMNRVIYVPLYVSISPFALDHLLSILQCLLFLP